MKWEYLIEPDCGVSQLDSLGREGWELVTVIKDDSGTYIFYFKRRMSMTVDFGG